ncbi:MAG: M23 family metallopeptidase [Melioribacteraceae bacterium]|nr:MAG: M23 family metallopeptidase [Melioribacteraceae bacterium]
MFRNLLLILLVTCFSKYNAQGVKFYGEFIPGSAVFGNAEGAKEIKLDEREIKIDSSGNFILGFDRDDIGEFLLKVKFDSGKVLLKKITLAEREYKIQRIDNMNPDMVEAPAKEKARIKKESEIIKEARSGIGKVDTAYYLSGFIKPVKTNRITSVFGSQRILNGVPKNAHNGLDFGAPKGTPVYAAADGIVFLTGDNFYYNGNFVFLNHGLGLNSFYLHLNKIFVRDGDFVKKGEKIGEIGTTGRSTAPHLHWGVQWFEKRVDPELLLKIKF